MARYDTRVTSSFSLPSIRVGVIGAIVAELAYAPCSARDLGRDALPRRRRHPARLPGLIARQTWADFELLAVDDGSADASPALVAAAACADPRVRRGRDLVYWGAGRPTQAGDSCLLAAGVCRRVLPS